VHWEVGDFHYRRCGACSVVWLDPLPSERDCTHYFGEGYFEDGAHGGYADYLRDAPLHRTNAGRRIALLDRLVPGAAGATRMLADVGCAAGFVMEAALARGWTPYGVDLSPWARRAAAGRACAAPVARRLDDLPAAPGSLDAVTFYQSLEHMPHPRAALATASRLLRPGGVVVIETWDRGSAVARLFGRQWQQVMPPSVLYLFDRPSLTGLLSQAGLALARWRASGKWVSLGHVTTVLAGKLGGLAEHLDARMRRSRLAGHGLPYGLGDLVTVVATKPA
jgi:SAM-dependent methyltransferase